MKMPRAECPGFCMLTSDERFCCTGGSRTSRIHRHFSHAPCRGGSVWPPLFVILSKAKNLRTDSSAYISFLRGSFAALRMTAFSVLRMERRWNGSSGTPTPTTHYWFCGWNAEKRADVGIGPYGVRIAGRDDLGAPPKAGATLIRRCAPPSPRGRLSGAAAHRAL